MGIFDCLLRHFEKYLKKREENKSLRILIKDLKHKEERVRIAAASRVKAGDIRALKPLTAALMDEEFSVRESAVEALAKIGDTTTQKPLAAALMDKEFRVRFVAAEALRNIGDAEAVESLIIALKDEHGGVRIAAAKALDKLGWKYSNQEDEVSYLIAAQKWDELVKIGESAVEPLIAVLKKMAIESVVKALAKIGDRRAVKPLIAVLKDEKKWACQPAAAEALGNIGDAEAVKSLIAVLKDENRWPVQPAAIEALGNIGDAEAVKPLIAVLKDEKRYVQFAAAKALDKLGWKYSNQEDEVSYLIAAQKWDELIKIGEPAIETLIAALKDKFDIYKLIAALKDKDYIDDNSHYRDAVAAALRKMGDAAVVKRLILTLMDKDEKEHIREVATNVLIQIGKLAVEPLMTIALSDDYRNSEIAIKTLGMIDLKFFNRVDEIKYLIVAEKWDELVKIGHPAVKQLIASFKKYRVSRHEAAETIYKIADNRSVGSLITALKHKEDYVRNVAARALGKVRDVRAVEPLITLIKDEKGYILETIVEALGIIGDNRATDPLIALLKDKNTTGGVRKAAAQALGDKLSVEFFIKCLDDGDDDLREIAANILGKREDRKAVGPLIQALTQDNWGIAYRAKNALLAIGDKQAVEPVLKFRCNHPYEYANQPNNYNKLFEGYSEIIDDCYSYEKYGNEHGSSVDYSHSNTISTYAVSRLSQIHTPISNNILHLITKLKNIKVTIGYGRHSDSDIGEWWEYGELSFENVREMAIKELEGRGNPPYDPSVFLKKEAWKL